MNIAPGRGPVLAAPELLEAAPTHLDNGSVEGIGRHVERGAVEVRPVELHAALRKQTARLRSRQSEGIGHESRQMHLPVVRAEGEYLDLVRQLAPYVERVEALLRGRRGLLAVVARRQCVGHVAL